MKVLGSNKKAYFNFEVIETISAGMVLKGWEVKSIKAGRISLAGSYIKIIGDEFFLEGTNVPKLKTVSNFVKADETRQRKLLLKKRQIKSLTAKSKEKGLTIVPLEVVQDERGLIKAEIALVRGRKKFDKRAKLKEQDIKKRVNQDRKFYNI